MNTRTSPDAALPFTPLSPRILKFREASRLRGAAPPPNLAMQDFAEAFFGLYARRPYWERYARSLALALERKPVVLLDDERLTGMLYQNGPNRPHDESFKPYTVNAHLPARLQAAKIDLYFGAWPWPGHIGWRWDSILHEGVEGLMKRLRQALAAAPDAKSRQFYRGALLLWKSALRWNDRYVAALRDKARTATGAERDRLAGLARLCHRVPRKPARTFHEAVQTFHFQHLVVMFENPYGGNGPGRLDYFLWPYLEHDLATGTTTREEAKELVDELMLRLHERIQLEDGWVEAVMVGGTHPDGSSSLNPLSSMILNSIAALDQTHPSVYVRLARKDPADFRDLTVRYLLHGRNRAQIYNEEACLEAITRSGVPPADAAMYMAGGCMEISVQGMASDMNFTGCMNVAKSVELVLNGGVDLLTGKPLIPPGRTLPEYRDFEDLYAAVEHELVREFSELVRALDLGSEAFARWRPTCLLSSLTGDCVARGRDQQDGGARYHDYGFAPLAITAAADSLHAIRQAVFEQRFVSAADLLAAMRADYKGQEALRQRLTRIPRYGCENAEADAMANRVMRTVCSAATGAKNRFGGSLKPMLFTFVWGPGASRELGARADGQKAGARIGHGMTPQNMAMDKGITAAINSCVTLDYSIVSGGATTMWDVAPELAQPEILRSLLKRYLDGGGMIFQGNTTCVEDLKQARKHPEQYPNLIVRVGGFSARFVTLSAELQEEILTRHRHRG